MQSEFLKAVAAAALVAFVTTSLGKVGGWLLLVVVLGLVLLATTGNIGNSKHGGGSSW